MQIKPINIPSKKLFGKIRTPHIHTSRFRFTGIKIIDWYIIRNFLGTFFLTEAILLIVAIVVDVAEKTDKLISSKATTSEIVFDYYMNFAIYYGNMYMALVVFLAVIIFTSKLAARTEIIAIISAGVRFSRLVRPYLIGAIFLALVSFSLNSWVLPESNVKRLQFTQVHIDRMDYSAEYLTNVQKQINPGEFIYLYDWKTTTNSGTKFTIERFDSLKLVYKLWAENIYFKADPPRYTIDNYRERIVLPDGTEQIMSGYTKDTVLPFLPEDFVMDKKIAEKKNIGELNQLIEKETVRGTPNLRALKTEKYKRVSMPFSIIILTIIGVSISSKKRGGGAGYNMAMGIIMVGTYIFMIRIFETTAAQGNSGDPLFWIWIPNIFFSIIAAVLYYNARK